MHDKPLLTIAIPTYNRSGYLAELLAVLQPQLSGEGRVELIVSDNASPDDTQTVLDAFRAGGLSFTVYRNETNLGADGNLLKCFERASGKYVWVFGDDDIIVPGAIKVVLDHLAADEYDLVFLRSYSIKGRYAVRPEPPSPSVSVIADPSEFARKINVFFTFISGNIVNKDRVMSAPHPDFTSSLGTSLVQLSWTYIALRDFRKGLYIKGPLIAARADNTGGYALFTVFGQNLKRLTEELLQSPAVVRAILNGTIQQFFPGFLYQTRATQHQFSHEDPAALLGPLFRGNYRYWLYSYPVMVLPLWLARPWVLLGKVVNRVDNKLGNPLLG